MAMLETLLILAQQGANQGGTLIGSAGLTGLGIGIGFGLTIVGAGRGIGEIGGNAVQSIARQPEAVGPIGTNMIIAAALVEGIAVISMILLATVV